MIRKFGGNLRRQLSIDVGDYRKTVFLAGTGRSGTTWVEEIINSQNDFRIMFEPFYSKKIDLLHDWNYRQYLRSDDRREQVFNPATRILSGQIRNKWIDKEIENSFAQTSHQRHPRPTHLALDQA